jgi:hypothetical protein
LQLTAGKQKHNKTDSEGPFDIYDVHFVTSEISGGHNGLTSL